MAECTAQGLHAYIESINVIKLHLNIFFLFSFDVLLVKAPPKPHSFQIIGYNNIGYINNYYFK